MQSQQTRYYWVDILKVFGIFLIYYGHVLQRTYRLSPDAVFFQYKLIYAFHLPLFFFISGFFYKNNKDSKFTEIGVLFQKRIFPVLLFLGISFLIWPVYLYVKFGEIDYDFLIQNLIFLLEGKPHISATLWFLVCLFVVEIWALLLLPKIKTVLQGILLSSFFLYIGYVLTAIPELEAYYILPKNFWYIHESVLAFGFYAMGYSTFRWMKKLVELNPILRIALLIFFGWVTVWSVNLNSPSDSFVVVLKASEHGNLYFFLSAFSGILATIFLASFIPRSRWLDYIGKNTLILLGTNSLFMSFFNSHIVGWLGHQASTALVIFDSLWISVLTIGLSVPVIEILNRWLPQWVGKPQVDGPIIKKISPPQFLFLRKNFETLSQKMGRIKDDQKS